MVTPFTEAVRQEWLDAYGHLGEGHYLVAFNNACWHFLQQLGVGVEYFERTGCALYTAESHLRFLKEVRAPAVLETRGMIFGFDAKRMRCGFVMTCDGVERATLESVYIHFDTKAGRAAAMPEAVQARLRKALTAELPSWAGRGIALERR
jgi:acyl-CoA thioesterase FadM